VNVSIIAAHQLTAMADLADSMPLGDFVEVGVFHGGSALVLYSVAVRQRRRLHLFDTFTGVPVFTEGLDKHALGEFSDPEAEERIRFQMPLAELHVGVYPDTHPSDMGSIAFIHCDCDQYISYRAVIDRMWPLVVPGGVLLFDDYPYLEGARKAVEESFNPAGLRLCEQRYYAVKRVPSDD
jgi:hypothetical protein